MTPCPVCGEPYRNKYDLDDDTSVEEPRVREDYEVCRQRRIHGDVLYVHDPSREKQGLFDGFVDGLCEVL